MSWFSIPENLTVAGGPFLGEEWGLRGRSDGLVMQAGEIFIIDRELTIKSKTRGGR